MRWKILTLCQMSKCFAVRFEFPLSSGGGGPDNFLFHLVFFPAASFLSGEGFSVVAVVACITAIERGVVNLLPYPSLP
jgi:hypothetical protein